MGKKCADALQAIYGMSEQEKAQCLASIVNAVSEKLKTGSPPGKTTSLEKPPVDSADATAASASLGGGSMNDKLKKIKPVAYLYHDATSAELADPIINSTSIVFAKYRRPSLAGETPLYTEDQALALLANTPKWTPVRERLPTENQYVLATIANGENLSVVESYWNCAFGGCFDDHRADEGHVFGGKVVAWMPLPAPYEGQA
jgi:hypothetical protein